MSEIKTEEKTPRTDAAVFQRPWNDEWYISPDFARTLECENAELTKALTKALNQAVLIYTKLVKVSGVSDIPSQMPRFVAEKIDSLESRLKAALALLGRMAVNDKSFPSSSTCKCVTCVLHAEVEQFLSTNAPNNPPT